MNKIIGVTPRTLTEDNVLKEFVNETYVNALVKSGFNVIMLTLDNNTPEEVFKLCDGFLITGGSDLDPSYFNEKNEGLAKGVNPKLDILDKQVIEYAVKTKKPMLGICRGIQSINVFMGGSLFQDIGKSHESIKYDHNVITYKNNFIDLPEKIVVNSYHHQAIKDVAPGFKVIAKHEDGTIEAIAHDSLPIFAVQWHPEKIYGDPISDIIFEKFVELFK